MINLLIVLELKFIFLIITSMKGKIFKLEREILPYNSSKIKPNWKEAGANIVGGKLRVMDLRIRCIAIASTSVVVDKPIMIP